MLSAGLACQLRVAEVAELGTPAFDAVVQSYLDLIDWATGDPLTSPWAALRAEAGHPEPFPLNLLGIGNENYGPEYFERFALIKAAVDAHRPGITIVVSAGIGPASDLHEQVSQYGNVVREEHFYQTPEWVIGQSDRYDHYPRTAPKIFLGEWAAHEPQLPGVNDDRIPNTYRSALAEAAFLTGVERNADVVTLTSYAPLLNRLGAGQWGHNLIDLTSTEVIPTANYVVQQLFATTVRQRIDFQAGALPDGVYASSTADDDTQCVKVVNTTGAEVTIEVRLPSAGSGPARVITVTADLDAVNSVDGDGHPRLPVQPVTTTAPVDNGMIVVALAPYAIVALGVPLIEG